MKFLSSILITITLFLFSQQGFADNRQPFDRIVFFGDSLSDNGNLYYYDFGFLPKSPIYFQGRFSNGSTWAEHFAEYFKSRLINSSNYAVGGETAVWHDPFGGYMPYTLTQSYYNYIIRNILSSRSTTLYVILIGANDYLNGSLKVDQLTTTVVDNIKITIENLIYHGGKNFLILNLPDLGKIPLTGRSIMSDNLSELSRMHNAKLASAVKKISDQYQEVNIQLFDLSALFELAVSDIKKFNHKYHTAITRLNDACWQGGYTVAESKQPAKNEELILKNLNEYFNQKNLPNLHAPMQSPPEEVADINKFNKENFARYIANSPALLAAFEASQLAKRGSAVCLNPDAFLFWDKVHPTRVAHQVIATEAIIFTKQKFMPI